MIETLPAAGSSMFPFVPTGSVLHLRSPNERTIRVGDIVCHSDRAGQLVAHRVLAVHDAADGARLVTRGDALDQLDRVALDAIAWRVARVERGAIGYDTDGLIGRALSHIAIRHRQVHRTTMRTARLLGRALRRRAHA